MLARREKHYEIKNPPDGGRVMAAGFERKVLFLAYLPQLSTHVEGGLHVAHVDIVLLTPALAYEYVHVLGVFISSGIPVSIHASIHKLIMVSAIKNLHYCESLVQSYCNYVIVYITNYNRLGTICDILFSFVFSQFQFIVQKCIYLYFNI